MSKLDEIIVKAKQERFDGTHKLTDGWQEVHTPTLKKLLQDWALDIVGEDEEIETTTLETVSDERVAMWQSIEPRELFRNQLRAELRAKIKEGEDV